MKINVTKEQPSRNLPPDMELMVKAVQGIADVAAGRTSPIEAVRQRVLARYETSRVRT